RRRESALSKDKAECWKWSAGVTFQPEKRRHGGFGISFSSSAQIPTPHGYHRATLHLMTTDSSARVPRSEPTTICWRQAARESSQSVMSAADRSNEWRLRWERARKSWPRFTPFLR